MKHPASRAVLLLSPMARCMIVFALCGVGCGFTVASSSQDSEPQTAPPPSAQLAEASESAPAQPAADAAPQAEGGDLEFIDTSAQNNPLQNEMTPELQNAVDQGFRYLASQQNADGSFGRSNWARHAGITALCALALMADGNVPGRGEYGENVAKALEFILANTSETGFIAAETTSHGPMYGHGFSTLFLGEIYGMNPEDDRVREALVRAVDIIIGSQNEEGGWRYQPIPYDADTSVTICEVMALRSARNAGIKVPKETIDRAVAYVHACQNEDGGFRYMTPQGGSLWPRTAGATAALFYAGLHEDESIQRGIDYLNRNAMPGVAQSTQAHYYYGHYYAVQTMYLAGGEDWETWWPAIRQELIEKQAANGGWLDHHAGGAYATAMALIILQMPKRYLPIFQK